MPRKPKTPPPANPVPVVVEKESALSTRKKSTKPHEPTQQTRFLVQLGKSVNLTNAQIAERLGVHVDTMEKHYRSELENGAADINMKVANNLLTIALQTQDRKAALTASIFWLKSKGGFNDRAAETQEEKAVIESAGPVRITLKLATRLGEAEK